MVGLAVWAGCGASVPAECEKQAGKNFCEVLVHGWSMKKSWPRRPDDKTSGRSPTTGVAGMRKRGNNSDEIGQQGTVRREFQNPSRTFRMSNA
jgi:hypothetical protein